MYSIIEYLGVYVCVCVRYWCVHTFLGVSESILSGEKGTLFPLGKESGLLEL